MTLLLRRTLVLTVMLLSSFSVLYVNNTSAQILNKKESFNADDSLRGTLNANRNWWNVLRYDITVKPNIVTKEITGIVLIQAIATASGKTMQLDLQQPLIVDSIVSKGNYFTVKNGVKTTLTSIHEQYKFIQTGNIVLVELNTIQRKGNRINFHIYYHGKPKEAIKPPWDGGWIWKKDKQGNPFVSVAVQGLGASAWFPCKDHQSDEPDLGATLKITVPDTLVAVGNGKIIAIDKVPNTNLKTYTWQVKNPINSYNIIPYIGKYAVINDTLKGKKGTLNLSYWVLDYNTDKALKQFEQVKLMLRAFEYWFGPYPFYEDGYKIVEAPHLGMEHQSAIAYGNNYKNGYLGTDRSGNTGWGLKWDFIIIHESGHEWFGNNITAKDVADMWIHEAFTTYSETLFTEYYYGKQAANEYNYGQRKNIRNDVPIIGQYGVNKEGSSDMYDKGSNMIHTIRHAINNDTEFRKILQGLNNKFYHKTVDTKEIESYINKNAGFNFQKVFDQYLRTTQIPVLEYKVVEDGKKIILKYTHCVEGFNLPIWLNNNAQRINFNNNSESQIINADENILTEIQNLDKLYYIQIKEEN